MYKLSLSSSAPSMITLNTSKGRVRLAREKSVTIDIPDAEARGIGMGVVIVEKVAIEDAVASGDEVHEPDLAMHAAGVAKVITDKRKKGEVTP